MYPNFNGGVMMLKKWAAALEKALEYSLCGLVFFIPVSIALTEIFTALVIGCFVAKKALEFKTNTACADSARRRIQPADLFLALFLVFCCLSVLNSAPYLGKSLNALFGKWGKFLLLYWAVASNLQRVKIRWVLGAFFLSGALVAIDAYAQKFLGYEFLLGRPLVEVNFAGKTVYAITGALKHSNNLAAYLMTVLPLLTGFYLAQKGTSSRGKWGTSLRAGQLLVPVLLGVALVLTLSRGGWLGGVAGMLVLALFLPQKKALIAGSVIFFLASFLIPGFADRILASFTSTGDSGRYQLWDGAWAMIADYPLWGRGIGTFMAAFQDYVQGRGAMYAHHCYLQIWAETGVFSLLFFLLFLAWIFKGAWSALRKMPEGEPRYILAGFCGGAIAFLVQSMFDTNLYSLQPSALFWLFMGSIRALSAGRFGMGSPRIVR